MSGAPVRRGGGSTGLLTGATTARRPEKPPWLSLSLPSDSHPVVFSTARHRDNPRNPTFTSTVPLPSHLHHLSSRFGCTSQGNSINALSTRCTAPISPLYP